MLKRWCARTAFLFAIVVCAGSFAGPLAAQATETVGAPQNTNHIVIASAEQPDLLDQQTQPRLTEPFGRLPSELVNGGLQNMWRFASKKLPGERRILMMCRISIERCPPAAAKFLSVINRAADEDGWTRIAEINRAINLDIRPVSDIAQYGVRNLWPTPLMAFTSNAGDCKDYAIAKYVALRELGISDEDIRMIIVHIRGGDEYHAIVAVRHDGRWLILDNRTSELRYDVDIADYDPLFVMDGDNVRGMRIAPPRNLQLGAATAPVKPMLFAGPESFPVVL
jgi:predicted transglutaminase-like cysteine proteinase